ncbi:MAG: sugar ABC transporter permease [bacterium]|nr:sugar ABC transporter permease [bacterium]
MEATAHPLDRPRTVAVRRPIFTHALPYLLIAPTFFLVFIFTLWPAIRTVYDSFFIFFPGRNPRPPEFVGLQNYADLFDQSHPIVSDFVQILTNTLIFTVGTVIFSIPIALLLALLLNRRIRGLGIWRFATFYPALLPAVGAASFWAFLYGNQLGLINTILTSFGLQGQNWTGDPDLVLGAITVQNIWKQAGYYMIFYLAGLQSIPRDIYEAADLDGAGYFQQLRYLTLPLLRRTTLFLLVVAFTFGFQTVEQLEALRGGLTNQRGNLLLYYIFQRRTDPRNWGYLNAMTVILAGLVLIFTVANFVFFERREDERG